MKKERKKERKGEKRNLFICRVRHYAWRIESCDAASFVTRTHTRTVSYSTSRGRKTQRE